jgi:acyl carrier protein
MTPEAKLQAAFVEALGLPTGVDVTSARYRDTRQWDSVAHMQLIGAIELAFDIMLDTDDVIGMSSYQRAREIVGKHGVAL